MKLRFTVGPVQDFVRQSRRTRDLWAGSFLLSYLSGHAMHGASQCGDLVLPQTKDDKLYAFLENAKNEDPTCIGSLPNRFELDTNDPERAARYAQDALAAAWKQIHDVVWNHYLADVADTGRETKVIFDRQVQSFWEIQWVAAENDKQLEGLLDRRKNWRSRIPSIEPGDKCSVMPQFQELSGYHRSRDSKNQDLFWENLERRKGLRHFELRPGERLCAIALIKRLYARREIARQTLGWDPEITNWRSTLYVAAIPWIEGVLAQNPEGAHAYARMVCTYDDEANHERPHAKMSTLARMDTFGQLDANYFHIDALKNQEMTFVDRDVDSEQRNELQKQLRALYKHPTHPVGPPASFYALLLMDGDRVGRLLADPEFGPKHVSDSLAEFTKSVQEIVNEHKGSTVYAGGDDVLAMVPVNNVMECAWALRESYRRAFKNNEKATTSAGIVLAHIRRPLLDVLDEAHRLLDDVAKEANGRDSAAISLLRSGDRGLQWVTTWNDEGGNRRVDAIAYLRDCWRAKATRTREGNEPAIIEGEFSSGLVYRLRETMGLLCGWPRWAPGECRTSTMGEPVKFFAAEVRRILRAQGIEKDTDKVEQDEAEAMAKRLLDVVHPVRRDDDLQRIYMDTQRMGMDGLLLALFLSTEGKESVHGVMEGLS